MTNKAMVSNPKAAALQGLAKMKFLADAGLKQAVLPPQDRPAIAPLKSFGFFGNDSEVLAKAQKYAPELLVACSSASSMWAANAATITTSVDALDGTVHISPSNLISKLHRSIEAPTTARILKAIFRNQSRFVHHPSLEGGSAFSDEGAANHIRFCPAYGEPGLHLFVYGESAFTDRLPKPVKFTARQTLEASVAIIRLHRLPDERIILAQQNPKTVESGVFHNDVISSGNQNLFFYHEETFLNTETVIEELRNRYQSFYNKELYCIKVPADVVSIQDAIGSYLFNSQIVTLNNGHMTLIAPVECRNCSSVNGFINNLISTGISPISDVDYFDLRQSMRNGGGPACLRLQAVLTEEELSYLPPGIFINDSNYQQLTGWVERHYSEYLSPSELSDPEHLRNNRNALDELTQILGLGTIYAFQSN